MQWVENNFPADVVDRLLHEEYENLEEYLDEYHRESGICYITTFKLIMLLSGLSGLYPGHSYSTSPVY